MGIGLVPFTSSGIGVVLHLGVALILGGGYGAVFRFQPQGYAAAVSGGLLAGLLWWMAGPLTLIPLIVGRGPTWSLPEASAAFPNLIGALLYGSLTGLLSYLLVPLYTRVGLPRAAPLPGTARRRRVVILGGGFAGVSTAQRLEKLLLHEPEVEVALVSSSNYLLFTPMLAEVASSALEAQHISVPVRASCPHTRFHRAAVTSIDLEAREVRIRGSSAATAQAISFDHLVLAVGSVPSFFGLPGMEANSFTLKTLQDATDLRNHVIGLLEEADAETDAQARRHQLTFVVVGGGFAGTEMIAELFDLVHSVRRYYPNVSAHELRFVLVHAREQILPEIGGELAAYALRELRARGIEFLLGTRVSGATPDALLLGDGGRIPTRTLVWTAGNQPNPLLRTLPFERNRAGAVVVESTLQVKGHRNIWAVGDCAEIPSPGGAPYPPTAQHALREGRRVAENVAGALRGQVPRPFRFRTIGVLVALGHRSAVAEIHGRRFSGIAAWLLWRGVYLGKLPGLEKKLRVLLDWTLDLIFPRDIVLTGSPTPALTEILASAVPEPR